MKTMEHSFIDYYNVKRYIFAYFYRGVDYRKDIENTAYVYIFPTSLDPSNKISKIYDKRFEACEELDRLIDGLVTIEIDYVDKQKWYAEMMYDGALLPMEN